MKKLKVLTVVGTRPEIIRLACILQKLDASPAIEHILVHTGQNYDYELNEVFFEDLGLRKPDYFLKRSTILSLWCPTTIFMFFGRKNLAKTKKHPFLSC